MESHIFGCHLVSCWAPSVPLRGLRAGGVREALWLFVCLTAPDCLQTLTFLNVFSTCRKQRDLDSIKVMLWCVCWAGMRWFLWGRGCLYRAGGGGCGDEAMSQNPNPALPALGWTA